MSEARSLAFDTPQLYSSVTVTQEGSIGSVTGTIVRINPPSEEQPDTTTRKEDFAQRDYVRRFPKAATCSTRAPTHVTYDVVVDYTKARLCNLKRLQLHIREDGNNSAAGAANHA